MNQEAIGNSYQNMSNAVSNVTFGDGVNTFNFSPTQVIQYVSVDEIKTRTLNQTSPYKGLKKFEPGDSEHFFGRDQLILSLMQDVTQSNLILLLGASGSGKSSVIQAGLITRLRKSLGTKFTELIFKPDRDPFISLFSALLAKGRSQTEAGLALASEVSTLSKVVTTLKREEEYWFIYIDQFEELFTISEPGKRDRFIESLTRLYQTLHESQSSSVKIVMTMRADFLDRFSPYADLGRIAHGNMRLIADMHRDELWLAIEQPAAQHGVVFEEGLVGEIIKDVQGQAGFLPLLQYTLELLWRNDDVSDRTLNKSTYRNLGGVRGSLQKRVEQVFNNLSADEQAAAKNIFLNLVNVTGFGDADTFGRAVSKRAYRSQFTDSLAISTVNKLVNENLLVSDDKDQSKQSTIEIAHEALLSSWDTLKQWIEEAKDVLAIKSRLAEDMARWKDLLQKDKDRANEELLAGSRLERILELRDEGIFELRSIPLSPGEHQFIDASVEWRDRLLLEKEDRIKKLDKALTEARLREQSAIVMNSIETQPLNSLILAIQSVGTNLEKLPGNLLAPVQVSLNKAMEEAYVSRTLYRHNHSIVGTVAISQDNNVIVSGDEGGEIYICRLASQLDVLAVQAHEGGVKSIAIAPDGQTILSGGNDCTVRLWNLRGEAFEYSFEGHEAYVNSVALSPDGQIIASGDASGVIRLWRFSGESIAEPILAHSDRITSIRFSPNGEQIASSSADNTIRLWNLKGEPIGQPFQQDGIFHIHEIAFSPDGQQIVSGSDDLNIRLWSIDGNPIGEPLHTFAVYSVAFSPDGKWIVSGGGNTLILRDLRGNPVGYPFKGHQGDVRAVAFSSDGQWIISCGSDKTIQLWSLQRSLLVPPIKGHRLGVRGIAFSPDGQRFVSGSDDCTVRIWNILGKPIGNPFGHEEFVKSVAVSNEYIVSGSSDKTLRLWDKEGKLIGEPFYGHEGPVEAVAFSPDGERIVSGSHDRTLRLWNLKGQQIREPFRGHESFVVSVAFSPDGQKIVSGSTDATLRLWDLEGNQIGEAFRGHEDSVYSVAFEPDGELIVSGSKDSTLRLWDLKGNQIGRIFRGHNDSVNAVAFSPDGQLIASVGNDRTLRLWNRQGEPVSQSLQEEANVSSVAFHRILNPYAKSFQQVIATGGVNGLIQLWIGSWQEWLQVCCNRLRFHPALNNPSEVFTDQKDIQVAQEACETCHKYVWKPRADKLNQLGLAKIKEKDFQTAIEVLSQALEFNPDHIEAYYNRAVAYIQKADYLNAVQDCDRAIGLIQNCSVALFSALLATLKRLKRFTRRGFHDSTSDRASDLVLAITFLFSKPNYADLHYKRGGCRLKLGDKQAAKADWQKAADLYRKQGQIAKTEKILEYLKKIH
ncbi:tetratricopeptide repeat protein [Microcoleus sp. EPA2]|jgi:WD40 repeat protein|uniref:nSTAND1 domain-containing NTPase n=1 Tax=Microcoleus sp. EPA2 TaxID=2841654 RepID=UPI00312B613F